MRFALSADQDLFAKSLRGFFERECASDALRAAWGSPDGRVPGMWPRLVELGATSVAVPEAHGGLGGDETDWLPVLEEAGRAALPEPLLGTLVTRRFADVAGVAAVGLGPGELVLDATCADAFLLRDGDVLRLLSASEVRVETRPSADPAARLGVVAGEAGAGMLLDVEAEAAFDRVVLGAAAYLLGLGNALLDMSVRYAMQREQFGRAIGSFQAVKHHLANAYIALAFARPVVMRAAWSVARDLPTRARDVSHAKAAAGEAAALTGRVALQVHGGIGYTYEHDLHMWLKRVWTYTTLYGDAAWHRRRVAAVLAN